MNNTLAPAKVKVGSTAPEFTLESYFGDERIAKDLKGKVVVLIFASKGYEQTVDEWQAPRQHSFVIV
jgi:hypothetical protein